MLISTDYAVGYQFCVFAILDIAAFKVTIMWVDVLPAEGDDEDEDEDEDGQE